MRLNRWTILAIILLLSTGVGLLFRPWGAAEGPSQTVEKEGLSLTCAEAVIVTTGSTIELQCEVTNNSRYQQDSNFINGFFSRNWDEPSNYVVSDILEEEIARGRYLITGKGWIYRNDSIPVDVFLRSWENLEEDLGSLRTSIRVEVKHPLFYYTALGLLLLQLIALSVSSILGILLAIYNSAAKKFAASRPIFVLGTYRTIDVLWATYITQVLLMIVFHIWDFEVYASHLGDPIFPPQLIYILTLPFAIGIIVLLFGVRRRTIRSTGLSSVWEQGTAVGQENSHELIHLSRTPFIGAIVTGWVFSSLGVLGVLGVLAVTSRHASTPTHPPN